MTTALITGITGQDGSYLAEFLIEKGYKVHGLVRRSSIMNRPRIESLYFKKYSVDTKNLELHYGDLGDSSSLNRILKKCQPDEVYNLAAQSHVAISFSIPEYTGDVTALGVVRILDAIKDLGFDTKFYQASSSEMYGNAISESQDEKTPMIPASPYACAKLYAYHITRIYREAYKLFACNGILFNHESPRRGVNFVTRKITLSLARIKVGLQETLELGNLDAKRDWGYAKDYCINLDVPILTVDGWKFFNEIKKGDMIINFNLERNCLSRDTVNDIILLENEGEKIELKGRGVYLNVSPNHRIIYQSKLKDSKGGWSNWKIKTAQEYFEHFKDIKLRTKYDYRCCHFQNYDAKDLVDISDELLYLIGIILTEGCLSKKEAGRGMEISISQSLIANEDILIKILDIIDKLDLKYRENIRNDGVEEITFNAESSRYLIDYYDKLNIHIMPKWCYSLSSRQANILLESLMDGDGNWGSFTFFSKRYLLCADFQTIALISGYRSTEIKKNKAGVYTCTLITKRKKHQYIIEVKKINDGNKKVWCIKTKNGTIITRDNGCVSISGNCEAMWLMLQQDKPDDYVIATGENHSVREFVEKAGKLLDFNIEWQGEGIFEKGVDVNTGNIIVEVVPKFYRPLDVTNLLGDPSKAKKILNWTPKVSFDELIKKMVDADLEDAQKIKKSQSL